MIGPMMTPQQEAAQAFANPQAAEVRTLETAIEHKLPEGMAFQQSLTKADIDSLNKEFEVCFYHKFLHHGLHKVGKILKQPMDKQTRNNFRLWDIRLKRQKDIRRGYRYAYGSIPERIQDQDWKIYKQYSSGKIYGNYNKPYDIREIISLIRDKKAVGDTSNLAELMFYQGEYVLYAPTEGSITFDLAKFSKEARGLGRTVEVPIAGPHVNKNYSIENERWDKASQFFDWLEKNNAITGQFWNQDFHAYHAIKMREKFDKAIFNKHKKQGSISLEDWQKDSWKLRDTITLIQRAYECGDLGNKSRTRYFNDGLKELKYLATVEIKDTAGVNLAEPYNRKILDWMRDKLESRTLFRIAENYVDNNKFIPPIKEFIETVLTNNLSKSYIYDVLYGDDNQFLFSKFWLKTEKPGVVRKNLFDMYKKYGSIWVNAVTEEIEEEWFIKFDNWKAAEFKIEAAIYKDEKTAYVLMRAKEQFRDDFDSIDNYLNAVVPRIERFLSNPDDLGHNPEFAELDAFLNNIPDSKNYMALFLREEVEKIVQSYFVDEPLDGLKKVREWYRLEKERRQSYSTPVGPAGYYQELFGKHISKLEAVKAFTYILEGDEEYAQKLTEKTKSYFSKTFSDEFDKTITDFKKQVEEGKIPCFNR